MARVSRKRDSRAAVLFAPGSATYESQRETANLRWQTGPKTVCLTGRNAPVELIALIRRLARSDSWASHEEGNNMIKCPCGLVHEDASKLKKVGWQEVGSGSYALMVNCTCKSTFFAAVVTDACLCCVCRRLVTGDDGDFKTVVWDGKSKIYCFGCARRENLVGWAYRKVPAVAAAITAASIVGGFCAA